MFSNVFVIVFLHILLPFLFLRLSFTHFRIANRILKRKTYLCLNIVILTSLFLNHKNSAKFCENSVDFCRKSWSRCVGVFGRWDLNPGAGLRTPRAGDADLSVRSRARGRSPRRYTRPSAAGSDQHRYEIIVSHIDRNFTTLNLLD